VTELERNRSPSTEVPPRATRRRFSAEYKERILKEADACKAKGELGALLRREGLYSSHLTIWRAAVREEGRKGLEPKKRGTKPKPAPTKEAEARVLELERQLRRMTARAERAEALVEVQKKVSQLLGIALPKSDDET
jgi:transposase-like protein